MKITQIYKQYNLIPGLRLHQLRVAGVAWQICDSLKVKIDTDTVIKACLLHDMGNIIKSDLTIFPEFIEKEGIEYWQKVKALFIKEFGNEEHIASEKIAKAVGAGDRVIQAMNFVGFWKASLNVQSNIMERKVCCYADMRVGPFGVLSLDERLEEGRKRYAGTRKWVKEPKSYEESIKSLHILEQQIFEMSGLKPSDVTDQSIKSYLEKLQSYQI